MRVDEHKDCAAMNIETSGQVSRKHCKPEHRIYVCALMSTKIAAMNIETSGQVLQVSKWKAL